MIRVHDLGKLSMSKIFCNVCGLHMNYIERMKGGYRFQDGLHDIIIGGQV